MRAISLYLGVPAGVHHDGRVDGLLFLSGFGTMPVAVALLRMARIAIDVMKPIAPLWLSAAW
jgi:hypothetical protein